MLLRRRFLCLVLLLQVPLALAYDLERDTDGQLISWNAGTISMQIQLGTSSALQDGSNYNTSVQAAMQSWNGVLGSVQFSGTSSASVAAPIDNNSINEIGFDSKVYGKDFGDRVLAVTMYYYLVSPVRGDGSHRITQADIIVNNAYTWNSYRGNLQQPEEIQRVALHELGHVLGLNHPDQATPSQNVSAIMNSEESNLYTLTSDDIAGAQSLYGAPNSAPAIMSQPTNRTVYSGQPTQYTISATSNPAPTYRWQRLPSGSGTWSNLNDGGVYSGTATALLSISSCTVPMNGDQFRCVASNTLGNVTSNPVSLSVTATVSPGITSQPVSRTVSPGASAIFRVTASGTPVPTYQWRKNGVNIAGATASTLTLSNVQVSSAGTYTVVVTNIGGSVASDGAILTISSGFSTDFNGDNQPDILWQNSTTGERFVWLMNGAAHSSGASLGVVATDWSIAATADFNGDGQTDILWQDSNTGERYVWFMSGAGHLGGASLGIVATAWSIASVADFNGDGQTDILWQNTSTGERYIWFMNGVDHLSDASLGLVDTQWTIVATADFNGDGQTDLLWQNTSTGERYIWFMNGASHIGGASLGSVSTQWSIALAADFNNDGHPDILWQNTSTGELYVWFMNGVAHQSDLSLGVVDLNWKVVK